jgi:hypothetical protein
MVRRGPTKAKARSAGRSVAASEQADDISASLGETPRQLPPAFRKQQFAPGQSGNPKGRPRKTPSIAPDLKAVLMRALNKPFTLTDGGRTRTLKKAEIGIEQMVNQFAKGDKHARRDLFDLCDRLGVDLIGLKPVLEQAVLLSHHQAIIDATLARQQRTAAPPSSPVVLAPPELLGDDAPAEPGPGATASGEAARPPAPAAKAPRVPAPPPPATPMTEAEKQAFIQERERKHLQRVALILQPKSNSNP